MIDRLSIKKDTMSPPGGWRYTVPETGVEIRAKFAGQAKGRILNHMIANAIPIPPDWDEWVDDQLCRANPQAGPWCGREAPRTPGSPTVLSISAAKRFLRTILHVILNRDFVSREEAFRRAAICKECPMTTDIGGCRGCSAVFSVARRAFPDNPVKTSREHEFCSACSCSIAYKVWVSNETLDKAEAGDRPAYHEKCWRND